MVSAQQDTSFVSQAKPDAYTTPGQREQRAEQARYDADMELLIADVSRWREKAVSTWLELQAARDDLDALRARLDAAEADFERSRLSLRESSVAELGRLEYELSDLRSSTSWRVTLPLRKVGSLLKRRQ